MNHLCMSLKTVFAGKCFFTHWALEYFFGFGFITGRRGTFYRFIHVTCLMLDDLLKARMMIRTTGTFVWSRTRNMVILYMLVMILGPERYKITKWTCKLLV